MGNLKGKVAVVTGASKGIGAAIAERLGTDGASVVVNYASDRQGAENVVAKITKSGGKAVAVQGDVAKDADVKKIFAEAKKAFGKLDILINNAGKYEFRPIDQFDEAHYRKLFDVNVLGLLSATREAVANMNGEGGTIINISSVVGTTPPPHASVYSATKGAVDVITRSLAQELGPRKIRVISLSPGLTETEGLKSNEASADPAFVNGTIARTPLGRIGTPKDIANAAAFLVSDEASWITGEALLSSGGLRL